MKIELKETGELERELSIEIASDSVKTAVEKKLAEVRAGAELKGFRKGKAPLDMIKSVYGDKVRMDVVDALIQESYPKAVEEKQLKVATRPMITALDFGENGELKYTAKVEVFPHVEQVKFDHLKLETAEIEVVDSEVDDAVEYLRKRHSEFRTLNRPAQETDVVVVDLKKLFDAKNTIPQNEFLGSEVDLANNLTVKEFREALPGLKAGDETEIMVKYDDDYTDPRFAGAEIRYHCTVKEVKERITPSFDDGFAKQTGMAETALELKLKIRENIKAQKEQDQKRLLKRQVVEQITTGNAVPIPEGLVAEYLNSVVEDFKKSGDKFDEKEVREQYRDVGINSMRWDLLWHRLTEQEKIEVLPADTENWINGFAQANNMTPQQAMDALRQSGRAARLRESLLEEKVLDFLIEKASKTVVKK